MKNKTIPKIKKIKIKRIKNNEPPIKIKRNNKKKDYSDLSFYKNNTSKYSSQYYFRKNLSFKKQTTKLQYIKEKSQRFKIMFYFLI